MLSKGLLLQRSEDLSPVRFRIVHHEYDSVQGFIGYGASNDDYISKIPYWYSKKDGMLDMLGAETLLYDQEDDFITVYENRFETFHMYHLNYAVIKFLDSSTVTIQYLEHSNAKTVYNTLSSHIGEEATVIFSPEPTGYL